MPGDLNLKKSWHPGLLRNQEQVWKREQEALEERKKIAERQKEIEREREREELLAMQRRVSGRPVVKRLEWMYSDAANGGVNPTNEAEEYLLGKRRVDFRGTSNEVSGADKVVQQVGDHEVPASKSDLEAKLRNDPLLAVRRRELEMLQRRGGPESYRTERSHKESSRESSHRSRSYREKYRNSERHSHSHGDYAPDRDPERSRDYSDRYRNSMLRDYSPDRNRESQLSKDYPSKRSRVYSPERSSPRRSRGYSRERSERSSRCRDPERGFDASLRSRDYSPESERSSSYRDSPDGNRSGNVSSRSRDYSPKRARSQRSSERLRSYSNDSLERPQPSKYRESSERERPPRAQSERDSERAISPSPSERDEKLKQMMEAAKSIQESREIRLKESALREEQLKQEEEKVKAKGFGQVQFIRKATQDLLEGSVDNLRRGRS